MKKRYFLNRAGSKIEEEVTKLEWIRAERIAGFKPKGLTSNDLEYTTTCATGSFSGGGVSGYIIFDKEEVVIEELICAAIYWNDGNRHVHQPFNIRLGIVVCGWRHHNILPILTLLGKSGDKPCIHGFMTTKGRFVDKDEAKRIAAVYGVVPHTGGTTLTSEDLY